jgi:hypothetical protein
VNNELKFSALPVTSPVIAYAMPNAEIRGQVLLRISRWAAWLPLITGVLITVMYAVSRADVLEAAGAVTILIGILLSAISFTCVMIYFFLNRLPDIVLRQRVNEETTWVIVHLILDYVAAFFCMMLAGIVSH